MHRILAAALLLTACVLPAGAADIIVFSPGIANAGLRQLADNWTFITGNKVTITGGNVGRIVTSLNSNVPADLVLLPPANLEQVAAKLRGDAAVPVGKALFGLAVKAGGPTPDVSTLENFAAALKQAGTIGFPDPATGSLSGAMVAAMLKRPEFAGVTPKPLKENAAAIVMKGDAPMSGGVIAEEIADPGVVLVGLFPEALDMHIELSGAIPANAQSPADGRSFLKYISTPDAALIWHDCGIDADDKIAQTSRLPCAMPPRGPQ